MAKPYPKEFRDDVVAVARKGDARQDVERRRIELKKSTERLTGERGKLMEAHYAGAIPVDLLGQEQDRISKALANIQTELDATNEKWEVIERNLGLALDLATDTHAAHSAHQTTSDDCSTRPSSKRSSSCPTKTPALA